MDIDSEHLGIPDTDYEASVKMSSSEFGRLCRDLSNIGESVTIDVQKDGISFMAEGEIGKANLHLKQGGGSGAGSSAVKVKKAKGEEGEEDDMKEDDEEEEEEEEDKKSKKRKRGGKDGEGSSSKGKAAATEIDVPVQIELTQAVKLTFSLKYLSNFAKAAPLSAEVKLSMSKEFPLLCEFAFETGHVRYYLAPKLAEDDE